jgi:MYXO-CTERM domain-containing protein
MRTHRAVVTAVSLLGIMLAAATAHAQGYCACNNGCHSYPGQCTHENGCDPGYAPTCDTRPDGGCPQVGWVSCSGTCTCTPIPGWDAGVTPPPEAGPPDSGAPETGTEEAGPPDAALDVVDDVAEEPPAVTPPPVVDAGCDCPIGTLCVGPDNFCAEPCGPLEFPCPLGYSCNQGFCIPDCILMSCALPSQCDYGSGQCIGGPAGPDAGLDAGTPGSVGGNLEEAGSGASDSGGSAHPGAGAGAGADADTAASETYGPLSTRPAGGCACSAASSDADPPALAGAMALVAAGLAARLRRKRSTRAASR